ncbi:Uncharacterised protein [Shigella flexneri]|nr:Uncharacterised protein [Shigella flexneri]
MLTFAIVHPQALAAPQSAILPHTDTVERQSNDITAIQRPLMLCQTRRCMGMMMQYRLRRQIHFARPLAGDIARMHIMHNVLRSEIVDVLHQA